jgi:hypothetical protein
MKIKLTALSLVLMLGACGERGVSVKRADYAITGRSLLRRAWWIV